MLAADLLIPDRGEISIGPVSATRNLDQYRSRIAYVPQSPYLFHGTIRDNLILGNSEITEEEMIRAAKICQAHEFIQQLPNGYDTVVSERGSSLSGGQRQRLTLVRAVLSGKPYLILDEATSALDIATEQALWNSLREHLADRTLVVITHRLTTITFCDRIDYMERGAVIASGTHRELIENYAPYAALYSLQDEAAKTGA